MTDQTQVKMSFDPSVAKELDTDAAIIYENIKYWVSHSANNEKNFIDGRYWMYNSAKAFAKQFTWISIHKIRRKLKDLEEAGYIESANHNDHKYDRTMWYTCEMQVADLQNGSHRIAEPIPNNKTDNKNNTSDLTEEQKREIDIIYGEYLLGFKVDAQAYRYAQTEEAKSLLLDEASKKYRLTPKRSAAIRRRLDDAGYEMVLRAIRNCAKSDWHTGKNDSGWTAGLDDFILRSYEKVEEWASKSDNKDTNDWRKEK